MEKYLEGGELTVEEIKEGLRARTVANEIVPVLGGSAFKNKGVQDVLDAVVEYLPEPNQVRAIESVLEDEEGTDATGVSNDETSVSALGVINVPVLTYVSK